MADKDFFISYTGADQAWAEWIAETLEQADYVTVLQAWDFRPGENFIQRMNQALDEAKRVLAVLSPAYFASEYARDEWTAALVRDRGQGDRLLPVRVAACQLPPLLANRVYIDLVDLEEQLAAERLRAGVEPGRVRPVGKRRFPGAGRPADGGVARFPGRPPAIFNVPARNPNFTGRGELLQALRGQLAETATGAVVQAEAIHGLGGVGKTQLALEFAHRFAADYDLVWWIPAEQPVTISGRLAALARRLELRELPSLEEQVAAVFDELGQRDRWLLVYDNAEVPADLEGLRPPAGGGHLLITSRNPAWRGVAATIGVDVLSRDEAIAFLRQRSGSSDQATLGRLAEALGDLPLALEQAAAYLDETSISVDEYVDLLGSRARELFALGRPATTEQTIATTWTVSLQRLREQAPAAEDLLRLCAFLAADDIPRTLPAQHPEVLPERLASTVQDQLDYQQVIGTLRRYSMVKTSPDGATLSVHRLVQAVTRHQLDPNQQRQWAVTALGVVKAGFPADHTNPDVWPDYERLLPHVLVVTQRAMELKIDPDRMGWLLNEAGLYLWQRADHAQARILLESALSIYEAHRTADDPEVAQSLNNLANLLRTQGDLERALAIREARLGPDHPDTASSLSDLANVLADQGDLDRARTLYERALAINESRLGPDHPHTADSLYNLAAGLVDQGDLDGARPLLQRALSIYEGRLGHDHPDTVRSRQALAAVVAELEKSVAV
jgi:tetratricopeptide (TPR) repeat protein